jgi:N utilization substance protein A
MSDFNPEIVQIAETVARDKNIPKDRVYQAIERAYEAAGVGKYGKEHKIKAHIDKKTGEVKLFRELKVVDEVEDPITQISLRDAKLIDPEIDIDQCISEPLPPIDLMRLAAQKAKSALLKEITDAEREREYEDFKDRKGEVVFGTIKRLEYGNAIIDLSRAEALLKKDYIIKNETLRPGDRIRAYVEDIRRENKGPQIILSRTHNEFLAKLFAQEVPEIYDNIIKIKGVAREPGSRAKVAVYSEDISIDPVASCVGVRGARVQAVINELHGEKIDIIPWSSDPATFVVNALSPAEVSKVVIDEDKKRIEIVVPDDQLSLAIGRRGQNVRLASQLTGWNIDILTENEESKRRVEEFNTVSELFIKALDIEEVMAQLLAAEGFSSIEEIAYVSINDLASIEGFDEALAQELQTRATSYLAQQENEMTSKLKKLGVSKELIDLLSTAELKLNSVVLLAEQGIKTMQDLADLSGDELHELLPDNKLTDKQVNNLIMTARDSIA